VGIRSRRLRAPRARLGRARHRGGQRPDAYGHETEYLGLVLKLDDFLADAHDAGLDLEREFIAPGAIAADGAPARPVHLHSFLFRG
jgi:hypothetical protein